MTQKLKDKNMTRYIYSSKFNPKTLQFEDRYLLPSVQNDYEISDEEYEESVDRCEYLIQTYCEYYETVKEGVSLEEQSLVPSSDQSNLTQYNDQLPLLKKHLYITIPFILILCIIFIVIWYELTSLLFAIFVSPLLCLSCVGVYSCLNFIDRKQTLRQSPLFRMQYYEPKMYRRLIKEIERILAIENDEKYHRRGIRLVVKTLIFREEFPVFVFVPLTSSSSSQKSSHYEPNSSSSSPDASSTFYEELEDDEQPIPDASNNVMQPTQYTIPSLTLEINDDNFSNDSEKANNKSKALPSKKKKNKLKHSKQQHNRKNEYLKQQR